LVRPKRRTECLQTLTPHMGGLSRPFCFNQENSQATVI
jgi:hypothetical protein